MSVQTISLPAITDLHAIEPSGKFEAFGVGYDRLVYLLYSLSPASQSNHTQDEPPSYYRAIALNEDRVAFNVLIEQDPFGYYFIQPLPEGLLLAGSRTDDTQPNNRIYSHDGTLVRELYLGDGIEDVQTTKQHSIWTSFFDEGVYGDDPAARSGLVARDQFGALLYEFQPPAEVTGIDDCYALNVTSANETWCYYYRFFPLVLIRDNRVQAYWKMPLPGSHTFAIHGSHALFSGGYHDEAYSLFSLEKDGKVKLLKQIQFIGQDGEPLVKTHVRARANELHFIKHGLLYKTDVQTVLAASL